MVRQWRGKPSVYLDHCAFGRISETSERAKAFRDALIARNGSLAVSMLNFVEFAQVTDPRQLAAGEQLIDSILPRIYIQNPSYPHVIDAERKKRSPAGFPGNPDSDGNMLYHFTTPARMYGFPLTARGLFTSLTRDAAPLKASGEFWLRKVIQHFETEHFKKIGEARRRDVLATIQNSLMSSPTEALVVAAVEYLYSRRKTPLKMNDVVDLTHALVPTVYCDYVILDKNTAQTMNVAKRRVRELIVDFPFARIYSMAKNGIDQLIADLAADSPATDARAA